MSELFSHHSRGNPASKTKRARRDTPRKSLLALALAFAFPTAFAQSNVTLYGIVDVGVEFLDIGDESTNAIGERHVAGFALGPARHGSARRRDSALFTLKSRFSIDTGSMTNNDSIYWCRPAGSTATPVCPGVKLVTPLPPTLVPVVVGGMSAVNNALLQAITAVNSAGALFDRQAYLAVVTPYGAVLGAASTRPVTRSSTSTPCWVTRPRCSSVKGYNRRDPGQQRVAVPGRAEGFHPVAHVRIWRLGGAPLRACDPATWRRLHGRQRPVQHANWGVGLGYNRHQRRPYATQAAENADAEDGSRADQPRGLDGLRQRQVYAQWNHRENENPILTPVESRPDRVHRWQPRGDPGILGGTEPAPARHGPDARPRGPDRSDAYHLGASWTIGNHVLYGVQLRQGQRTQRVGNPDAPRVALGAAYFYNFSRRTALYAVAAFMKNSDQSRMSLSSAGYTTGWTTGFGEDATALQLGMRHSF